VPHFVAVFCDRVGILISADPQLSPKVKVPTLPLQNPQGQGWGTHLFFLI
jgi:hypothetical protein